MNDSDDQLAKWRCQYKGPVDGDVFAAVKDAFAWLSMGKPKNQWYAIVFGSSDFIVVDEADAHEAQRAIVEGDCIVDVQERSVGKRMMIVTKSILAISEYQ